MSRLRRGLVLVMASALPSCSCAPFGHSHPKWAECRVNLKAWYIGEVELHATSATYSPLVKDVSFSPERGNRYAYFASRSGSVQERSATAPVDHPNDTGVAADTYRYGPSQDVTHARALDLRVV